MTWELICFAGGIAAIAIGCLLPKAWMPPMPNDKLMHFLAYGAMAWLATRIAHDNGRLAAALLVGLLVAGWAIEVLQNQVPGRAFCWRDMAANAAGIALAAIFALPVAI